PLTIPLLELSGRLMLAEGKLGLRDSDCRLLGAPASLSLDIGLHSWEKPLWNLQLAVPALDLGTVTADLPWVMRYSMGITPISGLASLTVHIGGEGPEMMCAAQAPELRINLPAGDCRWTGKCEYRRSPVGGDRVTAEWSWLASETLRPVPRFLDRQAGGLFERPQPPYAGTGRLTGTGHGAFFVGMYTAGSQRRDLRGTLADGRWNRLEVGIADADGALQSSSLLDPGPPLLALALLAGW
ncbi:MAG TPA: hypothetical protein PKO06_07645, partial [Candidatus Ozemobacteraceae bacterium]|nr:hypothetical protein [Candidatus Ozemobacteraceae bacterium]